MPQLTIFTPVLYLLGLFGGSVNFLFLFHLSMWFEELFFLAGAVLLASLYYQERKAVFFTAVTLLGTVVWYPQIFWNFHVYYFIPMVLYCLHRGIKTRLFTWFAGAVLFFLLSLFGNFVYCIVFSSFVVFLYLLCLLPVEWKNIKLLAAGKIDWRRALFFLALLWGLWVRWLWRTRSIERFLSLG